MALYPTAAKESRDVLGLTVGLLILAVLPIILLRPHVGILTWNWVGLMNPHKMTWGLFSSGTQFSLQIALLTSIATLFSSEKKRFPIKSVTVLFIAFSIWITITTLMAHNPAAAWQDWERTMKIFFVTFLTIVLMQKRERLHALVWVVVISMGYFGATNGLETILTGGKYIVWGPPGTFIADNNQLAMAMIMTLPLIRYLQLSSDVRLIKLSMTGLMILTVFSILGSQSRGAFLGLIAVTAMLILKSRNRGRLALLTICLLGVAAAFVPDHWVNRMETLENVEEDKSAMGRIRAWTFNFRLAVENPVFGGGFNAYQDRDLFLRLVPEAPRNANAHSIYFEVLGEHSFIGLALFLSLGIACWKHLNRIRKITRDDANLRWAYDLASMVQVSLIGYFSAGAFLNLAFFDYYYTLLSVAVVLFEIIAPKQTLARTDVPLIFHPVEARVRG
ncbi:putative O-glycosylation ligase, exosortase A system-associated [Rhodothalassium salexigens DSM 2132]|nr:putative O-glycosylation ligase, exosortase A system-associated [Rhodothalassium salexigens DSM 2132]